MKHKHSELIKKWADGAKIQIKYFENDDWKDVNPAWGEQFEYRIKPEKKHMINQCSSDDAIHKANTPQRTWVGLTNGEMIELSEMKLGSWDLILEVEDKLKDKNMKSEQIKHSLSVGIKSIQSRVFDRETDEVISFVKIPIADSGLVRCDAKKQLTDEEIKSCWNWETDCQEWAIEFARAILRKAQRDKND